MDLNMKKHLGYYLALTAVLLVGLVGIFLVGVDKQLRLIIIMSMASWYILWGLLHHYIHHDMHIKIVLEYVLIGSFAIAIAFMVLH